MMFSLFIGSPLLIQEAGGIEVADIYAKEGLVVVSTRPQFCWDASPEGLWTGRSKGPWVLCFHHRNVMTVPFFPICQASKGKKRIIIRSWSRDSSSVSNLKKLALWVRFCSAVPTTPMEETRRWAQGSVDLFINKVMPGRIVTLTRCKEHKS